ncbi:MAG: c-type cytochrome [Gemmatimonadota bacterium]|nr:c-type cytochrome [Gemmatimonadota bacterium]
MRTPAAVAAVILLVGACGGGSDVAPTPEEAAEARRAARADSVARAAALYDAAVFDTIAWESDNKMWERGGVVWSFSCQKCHAADGRGEGEVAVQANLDVPDLLAAEWPLAGDVAGIRRAIFVGHESAMPSWGLVGLKYRDIDAVSNYIDGLLRAED